jgi:hypothetical protein
MINLLPPQEKKILFKNHQKKLIAVLCIEFFVFLMAVILIFLAVYFYILGESSSKSFLLENSQKNEKPANYLDFKNIIIKYNRDLGILDSFYRNQKFVTDSLINLLEIQRPNNLYFTNLSLQPQTQGNKILINISGFSETRESLIYFKENLEANKKITNINFSSGSWISPKNIIFNITLEATNGK